MAHYTAIVYLLRSARVRILLGRMNETQEWLASQLSTSASEVSHLLSGRRPVSPERRKRFLSIFRGRSWDDLFEVHGDISERL